MLRRAGESQARDFIVGTEMGLVYRLRRDNPDKRFHLVSEAAVCPTMKMIDLEKILWSLEDMKCEVSVPDDIRNKARRAVDRMVETLGRRG
jgi:quinolinate synthase